jgi:hypothetical protein
VETSLKILRDFLEEKLDLLKGLRRTPEKQSWFIGWVCSIMKMNKKVIDGC